MLESIKVYNEDGEEIELYVIEQTQIAGNTYLLAVEDEDSEESDMWIFKQSGTKEDELFYDIIEDDTELQAVAKVFEAMLDDCDIEL